MSCGHSLSTPSSLPILPTDRTCPVLRLSPCGPSHPRPLDGLGGPASARVGRHHRPSSAARPVGRRPTAPSCGRRRCDTRCRRGPSSDGRAGQRRGQRGALQAQPSPAGRGWSSRRCRSNGRPSRSRLRAARPPGTDRGGCARTGPGGARDPRGSLGWCRARRPAPRRLGSTPSTARHHDGGLHSARTPAGPAAAFDCLAQRPGACASRSAYLVELYDHGWRASRA